MSNETYRQFDPWRPSPVKEISRRQIVETHYFNVDHVSYESNQIGSFERYFVQENNGDTVAVLAVTDDGMIPVLPRLPVRKSARRLRVPTCVWCRWTMPMRWWSMARLWMPRPWSPFCA